MATATSDHKPVATGKHLEKMKSVSPVVSSPMLCCWLLLLLSSVQKTMAQTPHDRHHAPEGTVGCDIYMAESSIPGAGRGVYTARDFSLGEVIGLPSIGIPVTDLFLFTNTTDGVEMAKYGALPEFLWEPQNIGGFGEALQVDLFLPGAASLINHHPTLDNVLVSGLTLDRELQRDSNPMAGSFTAYHGYTLIAKRNIKAGEELFADKSTGNLVHRQSLLANLPSLDDYAEADEIVAALRDANLEGDLTDAQWVDVLHRLKTEIMPKDNKNVANALPSSFDEIRRAWEVGTARMPLRERTVEWIKNNGQCLDGIKEGTSTIQDAGRGAFATKTFRQGSIVSVSPLVQIPDKTVLDISHRGDSNSTQQLLYNYCFGHRKSSLLLCPTTHAAMINHDSSKANVALRWVRSNDGGDDLTVGSIDSLGVNNEEFGEYNTRLQLEYVTLRDIGEGEELFLDYGKEWEDALLNHIEHGTSSVDESRYVSAKSLTTASLKMDDGGSIVDQSHIYECKTFPDTAVMMIPAWEEYFTNQNTDQRNWPAEFVAWYEGNEFASWYPCKILDGDSRSGLYNIELFMKPLTAQRVARMFKNIPRNRIRIVDGLYQSDQHLPWSFRQYVPMPDSLFPLRWRNDYQTSASLNLGKVSQEVGTPALVEDYERALREAKCGLYLAKSNIPNAGSGLYTGLDIPAGDIVIGSLDLAAIPVLTQNVSHFKSWPVHEYVWSSIMFASGLDDGYKGVDLSFLWILFGALPNAHSGIMNLRQRTGRTNHYFDRNVDPGAGAVTPYGVQSTFTSEHSIRAGEELFISYGEHWFKNRPHFKDVPMKRDFMDADDILAAVWAMTILEGADVSSGAIGRLLQAIRGRIILADRHRLRMALAAVETFDDLSHVFDRNGTALATVEAKPVDWLDEHGICLDHIYIKESTLKEAASGAFSRRFLKNGTIIMASPTLVSLREYLTLNTRGLDIHPTQLATNYHFGHKNSSVLFFPLTQAIAINHISARKPSGQEPNACVEFSKQDPRSRYVMSRTIEEIKKERNSAIVLTFVATRDIQPDEEIFIDYGKEWEDAWDDHVSKRSESRQGSYIFASKNIAAMNNDVFNETYHQWSDNHFIGCQSTGPDDMSNLIHLSETYGDVLDPHKRLYYNEIDYGHEGFAFAAIAAKKKYSWRPCVIESASRTNSSFNVVQFMPSLGILQKIEGLPANHVNFFEKPFKSDIHDLGGFRHEILIPDEVFPELWKDLG